MMDSKSAYRLALLSEGFCLLLATTFLALGFYVLFGVFTLGGVFGWLTARRIRARPEH